MTKTYTFYDDSWWDRPGCSCCAGGLVECYNSTDTDGYMGSASSEDDCYAQAIITESRKCGCEIDDEYEIYCMQLPELKAMAEKLDITVTIVS